LAILCHKLYQIKEKSKIKNKRLSAFGKKKSGASSGVDAIYSS